MFKCSELVLVYTQQKEIMDKGTLTGEIMGPI